MLLSLPPLLHAPLFAVLFWWVALALGDRLLRVFRLRPLSLTPWEYGFLALAFGAGFLQFVPFGLSLFGVMVPSVVRIACVLLTVALLPDMLRVARRIAAGLRELPKTPLDRAVVVWASLLGLLLGVLLLRALTVRPFGDDDGYHLTAPVRWLHDGRLSYLPTYTHTNAPAGFELLYVIAIATWDIVAAKLLHYSVGLFVLLGLVLCARRAAPPLAGMLAISLLLVQNPLFDVPFLFGVAYVDLPTSWMMLVAALLWFCYQERREERLIACIALSVGFAGSFKFTALSAGAAWAIVLLLDARRQKVAWPRTFGLLAAFGAIATLPVLPWLYKNLSLTGNPLYPIASSIIPTRDWSQEHAAVFGRYLRYHAWGIGFGPWLDERGRQALLGAAIAGVLGCSALAYVWIKDQALRGLVIVAGVFATMAIAVAGLYFRYWLPATVCAVLVLACVAARQLSTKPWRIWPAVALMAVACLLQFHTNDELGATLRVATGVRTVDEEYRDDPWWKMWATVAQKTPADAKVLAAAFYTSYGASSFGGYWTGRTLYTTDSHLQAFIALDDWPAFLRSVDRAGIHYMLISDQQYAAGRLGFHFTAEEHEYPYCRRLADEYGEKLAQFEYLQFYRIDAARAYAESRK